jgi:putative transposase
MLPGVPVHLIQRGHNRAATFRCADDAARYRETLYEAGQRHRCAIHAYVLMTNHVHLLITPEDEHGPSRMMQTVGRRYVPWMNARYDRTGTMWEGRFRSSVIDSERYLFTCSRYIELNPVRARMVYDPAYYRWSSHRHNARGEPDALITPHPLYQALGANAADRRAVYRTLFLEPLEPQTLDRIRHAARRGTALADESFCERVEAVIERPVSRPPHGGDRRSARFRASLIKGQSRWSGIPISVSSGLSRGQSR